MLPLSFLILVICNFTFIFCHSSERLVNFVDFFKEPVGSLIFCCLFSVSFTFTLIVIIPFLLLALCLVVFSFF